MSDDFQRGLLRAAEIADLYADENISMAHDTILADPILNERSRRNIRNKAQLDAAAKVSERLTLDGHGHSSRYHAGKDIAEMIRNEADAPKNAQSRKGG